MHSSCLTFNMNPRCLTYNSSILFDVHWLFLLSTARQMIHQPSEDTMPPHAPVTTPAQSLPPASNTPANCPPSSSDAILQPSEKQQEILLIVLPVALATVVVVLFIAIVSIGVCVCATRRSTKEWVLICLINTINQMNSKIYYTTFSLTKSLFSCYTESKKS